MFHLLVRQSLGVSGCRKTSNLFINMKRTLVVILSWILLAASVQAQFQWAEPIATTTSALTGGQAAGMTLDSRDNIYVTGWFDGTNDFGGVTLTNESFGGEDIFVAKYNSSGALQWVRRAGGSPGNFNFGQGVGVDTSGNVYVTGGFSGPADFGSTNLPGSLDGSQAFFLAKYDNGGTVQWVQQSSGYSDVNGNGLAVDGAGNSYAVGYNNDGETITFGLKTLVNPSTDGYSGFLVKYDTTGTAQWAQSLGGDDEVWTTKVAVDTNGNVYVRGSFGSKKTSGATLTIGTSNLVCIGSLKNMFLAKFDNSGALIGLQHPTGGNVDDGGVAVDQARNMYVTGWFDGTLDFGGGVSLISSGATNNAFLAKYSSSGAIQWARKAGGQYFRARQ
jgi:hypothetical protein